MSRNNSITFIDEINTKKGKLKPKEELIYNRP
jgi:hypothetical protein